MRNDSPITRSEGCTNRVLDPTRLYETRKHSYHPLFWSIHNYFTCCIEGICSISALVNIGAIHRECVPALLPLFVHCQSISISIM
jgi:hypothetical protein